LNDPLIEWSSGGINITGYGALANISKVTPFSAENIVLITDGYCASTCTIFSEFLTKQAGVKTIAFGGRSNKNKIQAIGGVKGTNNYGWGYIQQLAATAIRIAPEEEKANYNASVLQADIIQNGIITQRSANTPGVNVRDGLAIDDDSGVALQFIYEEADCRLYYTPEMAVDAQSIWKAAADAQWGKSGKCVSGIPGYGEKRNIQDITTKLSRRRINVSSAMALKKVAAFEDSFALETECQWETDGFMRP
jgi:phosphotransferase system IIB component